MSQVPPTHTQPMPPSAPPAKREGGVDLATLIITALASAVAAYTCSKIWAPGTLASAAFTPVLVALVKEALRRPTAVVTTAVPVVVPRPRRRRPTPAAAPGDPTQVVPPPGAELPEPAIVAVTAPAVTTPRADDRRQHWRVALITGLLGFAVCAVAFTVPELVSGANGTTIFGGRTQQVHRTITTTTSVTRIVVPGRTQTTTAPATTTTIPAPTTTTTTVPAPATVTKTTTTTTPATPTTTATTPSSTTPAPSATPPTGPGTTPTAPLP